MLNIEPTITQYAKQGVTVVSLIAKLNSRCHLIGFVIEFSATARGQTARGQTARGQTARGQTDRGQTDRGQTARCLSH